MEFAGFVAADAPDPVDAVRQRIRARRLRVAGLVPQRHLEDAGEVGITDAGGTGSVSRTYLLWRNPDDRDDPANLAELDDVTRRTLDEEPLVPLPPWLIEARERLRRPQVWEAVQTHWVASAEERRSPAEHLVAHAEYVLMNRFAEVLGIPWPGTERWGTLVHEHALQPTEVVVDGRPRAGLLLDTDPFVLGLATELDDGRIVTVVVPRDDLPYLTLELASSLPV